MMGRLHVLVLRTLRRKKHKVKMRGQIPKTTIFPNDPVTSVKMIHTVSKVI